MTHKAVLLAGDDKVIDSLIAEARQCCLDEMSELQWVEKKRAVIAERYKKQRCEIWTRITDRLEDLGKIPEDMKNGYHAIWSVDLGAMVLCDEHDHKHDIIDKSRRK